MTLQCLAVIGCSLMIMFCICRFKIKCKYQPFIVMIDEAIAGLVELDPVLEVDMEQRRRGGECWGCIDARDQDDGVDALAHGQARLG
ncbi:hypothetical protein [Halomonas sp. LBP4]|uniref:hypothetical protein n=1 Tax=Halomonas sp. LBP4 TaxID=2044917 RepID=UPI000D76F878|nr:hypothetical protein [Halomonas sp. LBP4]PXX99475.1 hypothetical protein CR157_01455 [Halomonas sp. LBP4]